ncbi:Cysteine--tRNA ligase [Kluyvera cryocrescens]|uniref:Cysteine--tRNA ligase n=1 Tax=Kluyvera cryocrescens TaxID=580 RepID=A0A485CHJ3_KLUCR|nr:Cysteine--tRNA ligase [Kluyvera cryocrescens]
MDDDFNTPVAYAVLFDLAKEVNNAKQAGNSAKKQTPRRPACGRFAAVLGLLEQDAEVFLQSGAQADDSEGGGNRVAYPAASGQRVKPRLGRCPTPRGDRLNEMGIRAGRWSTGHHLAP